MPAEASHFYLGLATTGHDPALAIVSDEGEVLFAEATERSAQIKIGWGIPSDLPQLIKPALDAFCPENARFTLATSWAPLGPNGLIGVATPFVRAEQQSWLVGLNATARSEAGRGIAELRGEHAIAARRDFDHHLCHAANALHCAPFDDALCAVMDGEGDVGALSMFDMRERRLKRRWRSWGPASLGAIYGWLTDLCGFDWAAGEQWKVMGLAAFADPPPDLEAELHKLIGFDEARPMLREGEELDRIIQLARSHARHANDPIDAAAPLAAAAQAVFARWADTILMREQEREPHSNLMLSGGCALNSSYNGTVQGRMGFARVHVPSAPGDDGNALGAALLAWQADHPHQSVPRGACGAFLGTHVDARALAKARQSGAFRTHQAADRAQATADMVAAGKIVGVMQGRAEFGPRALGHRSILADPRAPDMKDRINKAVKGRESYRPFAPVVEADRIDEFFDRSQPAPFMSFTLPWRKEAAERFPAVVHADGTGRVQTVERGQFLFDVLQAMPEGADVLLNTSLNVMGKPIVHNVEDAITVLATTELDALVVEDVIFEKLGG
ncbi:carbamoyltransferase C-terminal domain-containing protein [Citromicrobium bathyomarinum]|uniref:carbamoyltransferase C-terminal domain-containing protein n=1 Tax=Citromicrobium bathyomarinum TaxID=72174 RepID=UPI00315ABF3D